MMKLLLLSTFLASTSASSSDILSQIKQHQRRLQATADPCESTNGELLAIQSFYEGSLGQCQCSFSNDLEAIAGFDQEALGDPASNSNFWDDIVTLINDLLRSLSYEYSNSCQQKDCETCFGAACGTITASEKIVVEGKSDANLTLTEIFTLPGLQDAIATTDASAEELAESGAENITALAGLFGPNLFTQNIIKYCMEFSSEYTGKACLDIDNKLDGEILTTFTTEPQDCTLGYNGQNCATCEFIVSEDESCVKADCSSVTGVNSMVDTCAGTGLTGPFQFLDGDAASESTCGATQVISTCEGTGCPPTISEPDSGATSVVSLVAVGVAALVALMM